MRFPSASILFLSLVTLGASAVAACGGGQPEATTPSTPSATPSGSASAAPATSGSAAAPATSASAAPAASGSAAAATPEAGAVWSKDMTKDQKVAFMKAHVVPRMSKVFQAADAKKYAEFGCKTCHGPQYKDPQVFLPKLQMKDGKITAFETKPQLAKFMAEKVTPEMAAAMGQKPYDPATKQGFGCGGCHTVEMK